MVNERRSKTAYLKVSVWFNEKTNNIHVCLPDQSLSTVNVNCGSKRGHPHLFNKLAKTLRADGKPHPEIIENWNGGKGPEEEH